ncbi:calcium/sodium antiporter [Ancylomarina sp. 16SWW S1-10-2]|uniref:calcium/sodium antiporter n=1 Tax=Ancylomarina sp. 16SWW S1-10-2 TaxID=2499681 RepID=UPI0012AE1ACC|nr:calcium/sodium antiporter [Ancylomarina sp. 16SWW S1-10-2]MRT94643.1 calcium/sodium antiporter [Ancylomarina sp. 16SWW S1-10-2]
MDYLYLILGFVILLSSGDLLVKGGVALSSHFKISTLVVGVTVISFGTSAPELFVSLGAALSGSPDIAIGNVVGSNISNIALVLGFTAILLPLPIKSNSIKFDWPVMMGASLLFFIFAQNNLIETWEGITFLVLLTAYMIFTIMKSHGNNNEEFKEPNYSIAKALGLIVLASIGLYFGADLLVGAAKNIALGYGVSERVIGLTLVAFGTSVPELATSAIAALKKEMDISVGNIIGSNIFNIFGVLGVTSVVKNIAVSDNSLNFDLIWLLAISFLLFLLMLPLKRAKLHRWKGFFLILIYSAYVFFIFSK